MARPIRVEFEGAVYHVMARGNERRDIFRDDEDRREFLRVVSEMAERFGALVHAWCLMPNHYHLIVETPRANLSRALGWLQVTYTVRFNRRHKRSGHLFQGRFKAQLVDAEGYGRSLVRYVHLNPVRPRDKTAVIPSERREALDAYEWSSNRDYAGLRKPPQWLCLDRLGYWGAGAAGQREYRAFVAVAFEQAVENPWEALRGGLVLGAESLWRKAQALAGSKSGLEERKWVQGENASEVRARLSRELQTETDERVKIGARVRLGGERMIDVAKELEYTDGTAVTQIVRRLENSATNDKHLRQKMDQLKRKCHLSGVDPNNDKEAQKAQEAQTASASALRDDLRHSRLLVGNRFSLAIGITAVFVIAGATAFYFLHVVPENRFRQTMSEGQRAEDSQQWDDAENAYYRAALLRRREPTVEEAQLRVLEKRRLAEYAEAMARGKAAEQLGDWATALREYQTALLRKSDDVEAKVCVAEARYQLPMKEGRAAEQQKQWDMALIAYSHALAVKPSEEDAIHAMRRCEYFAAFERGQQSEAQQQWRDALAAYRKALCLQPHDQAVAEAINRINERLVANAMNTKTRTPEEGKTTTNLEWSRAALPQPKGSDSAQVAQLIFKKMDGEKISLREIPKTDKDAWDFARMQERVSDDSKKLYHLLGEQLLAADYLLQSEDLAQRQKGLAMAIQAGRGARRLLNDAELASAIADAFLLPNVKDSADEKPSVWLSRGNVIEEAIAAYKLAGDTVRQAAAYQMLLEFAPNRNTADFARVRLAELSQREGNHRRALEYLKEVEPGSGGMSAVRRLIPGIEKKLQLQSNKDGGTP